MSSEASQTVKTKRESSIERPRLWPIVLVAGMSAWCLLGPTFLGMSDAIRFYTLAFGGLIQLVALLVWGLFASGVRWTTRVLFIGLGIAVLVAAFLVQHPSLGISIFLYGVPIAIMTLGAIVILSRPVAWPKRKWILFSAWAVPILAWLPMRSEGYMASFMPQLRWRWSPTSEMIAMKSVEAQSKTAVDKPVIEQVAYRPGDWPRFRGPAGDGRASKLDLDVAKKLELKTVWSKTAGPSWGSVIVVDGWLYTLEQRGDDEVVVCLNARTGDEAWAYASPARFEDQTQVSGVGPRGTPTFHNGIVYSVGGTGHVTAIQATDGELLWKRDLVADTHGNVPMWGFSTSPYVDDENCIVIGNSESPKTGDAICYNSKTGDILWIGEDGGLSYSSPQIVELHGVKQILVSLARMTGEKKGILVLGRDFNGGKELWRFEGDPTGNAMLTPMLVSPNRILLSDGSAGTTMLEIAHADADGSWSVKKLWSQNRLLPEFSELLVENDMVLGLSKGILTALNLNDGKLLWKKFRYGGGQLIGLVDQCLLVLSEEGKLSFIEVAKSGPKLIYESEAIVGKTWNHPVVVGNRIYCRNSEAIACLEINGRE